jgi:hypothetical protein
VPTWSQPSGFTEVSGDLSATLTAFLDEIVILLRPPTPGSTWAATIGDPSAKTERGPSICAAVRFAGGARSTIARSMPPDQPARPVFPFRTGNPGQKLNAFKACPPRAPAQQKLRDAKGFDSNGTHLGAGQQVANPVQDRFFGPGR